VLSGREVPLSAAPGPAGRSPVPPSRAGHRFRLISQAQPGKRRFANKLLALSVTTALCVLGPPGTASAGGPQLGAKATPSASSANPAGIEASSLFRIAPKAESSGPVVMDPAGNGYVAWDIFMRSPSAGRPGEPYEPVAQS